MAVDIGPKIGIDGEKEFRQELTNINQQLRTLGSEMKAVTSSFEAGDRSEEALAAQGLTPPVLNVAHQAARLEVDEEGIRAVAYTELGGDTTSDAPPPVETVMMDLDRPFLVVISSPVEGVPLFVGVIHDPTAS